MVIRRSRAGMKFDSALSIVVLPDPVPPEMSVETLPATAAARTSAIAGRKLPTSTSRSISKTRSANFRIETSGPSMAIGRTATLTREPSRNRASTMGDDSSTRRPIAETIRLMMRKRCASSLKWTLVSCNCPKRSMKQRLWVLMRMSVTVGSFNNGSSGP